MKIVADENIPLVEEFFQDFGDVVRLPGRQMRQEDLRDADALLVRSVTQVNAALLADTSVRFVGTCTIGVDHLDADFMNINDIRYASAPGCNANSVVEYVYAALCHLDVNWLPLKVGIIGCGNVGGLLHRRLRAQGVDCYCYDPFLTEQQNPDLTSLEAVLACDIVSMHTPLTVTGEHPSFHLIGARELEQLKPGAVLLNCGRGPVIDNQALLRHLRNGKDLKVVLDVWEPEPEISLPLLERVALGTPHIAGYSYDGKLKGTEMIYKAFCIHLGVSPQKKISDLIQTPSENRLKAALPDAWSAVKQLIPQIYDIAADDRRLRELSAQALAGTADFGPGFDLQRKHYPVRREFHNYHLEHSLTNAWFDALGFRVS